MEPDEVFPDGDSSSTGLGVVVSVDVYVVVIVKVLSDSDFRLIALMTFLAGVLVVEHIAVKPVSIVYFEGASGLDGEICLVELLGGDYFFVSVDYCNVNTVGCQ